MSTNITEGARDTFPIPPAELHAIISGNPNLDVDDYFEIGKACASTVSGILKSNGVDIQTLKSILDFGCGAARIIRHFNSVKGVKLYGTDINPELVDWCSKNLPFAEFAVNPTRPPLRYDNEEFHLVYAFSVFTHLPEGLQLLWLNELSRVLKPGGYFVMTTHGEAYSHKLGEADRKNFKADQLVVYNEMKAEDPSTYGECNAFHPPEYVKQKLTSGSLFEFVDFIAGKVKDSENGIIGQDVYLLRKLVIVR